MKYSKILLSIFVCLLTIPLFAQDKELTNNNKLSAEVSFFGTIASGTENYFPSYKKLYTQVSLPLTIYFNDNIYLHTKPFARYSYSRKEYAETKVNVAEGFLNITFDNFNFEVGRMFYEPKNKNFFINYSENNYIDNVLPSALDGITHKFSSKYFNYTILASKESPVLNGKELAQVYGIDLGIKPFNFWEITPYVYHAKREEEKTTLYGIGTNILFDIYEVDLYFVRSKNEKETGKGFIDIVQKKEDNSFYAKISSKGEKEHFLFNNGIGVYILGEDFRAIKKNVDLGLVYSGLNLENIEPIKQVIKGEMEINIKKVPIELSARGYIYRTQKNNKNYEIDISGGINFKDVKLVISYGFLHHQIILKEKLENQNIHKGQIYLKYTFDLW